MLLHDFDGGLLMMVCYPKRLYSSLSFLSDLLTGAYYIGSVVLIYYYLTQTYLYPIVSAGRGSPRTAHSPFSPDLMSPHPISPNNLMRQNSQVSPPYHTQPGMGQVNKMPQGFPPDFDLSTADLDGYVYKK